MKIKDMKYTTVEQVLVLREKAGELEKACVTLADTIGSLGAALQDLFEEPVRQLILEKWEEHMELSEGQLQTALDIAKTFKQG